jgi:mediator of RNA polymerase II transcription subunit 16
MTVSQYNISETFVNRSLGQGRNNGVSWSRQGHIAYTLDNEHDDKFIKSEGNLRITYLECIDGKHWQLAPPTFFDIRSLVEQKRILTDINANGNSNILKEFAPTNYVSFSNTGWDLFTADENGIVTILVTGIKRVINQKPNTYLTSSEDINQNIMQVQYSRTSFNTCEVFYSEHDLVQTIPIDKGNQILTMKWLNLDKSVISNIPAMRIEQNSENQVLNGCASKMGAASDDSAGFYYRYNAQQHKSYGALHPLGTKQACIAVRKNGQICLYHQEEHGIEYDRVINNLDTENTENNLISRASIGFQKDGKIIVAAYYEFSKILKFYEIEIEWNYLNIAAKILPENPNYRVSDEERILPTLKINKICQKNLDNIIDGFIFNDVNLVSPNFEQDSTMDILLRFENKSLLVTDPVKTAILRYRLKNIPLNKTIHQSFKDIASKNGIDVTSNTESTYELSYVQALSINDSILNVELLHLDMYIAFILSSGIIKVFSRKDLIEQTNKFTEINDDNNNNDNSNTNSMLPKTISFLLDAGYEFPKMSKQPIYCCLSPNMCAYVSLPIDDNCLQISCATTSNIHPNYLNGTKKGLLLTKAAAIALLHTTACYFGYFTDDLVATIRNDLIILAKLINDNFSYRLMISIVQEAHRAINLNIDIPPEQSDKMTQNQPLQRLLTLQLSLGTSENWKKTRSGKIALALVNLRYIASSVMYTIHTIYSNMQRFARKGFPATDTLVNAKMREECILSVIGVIRWCLDYVVMLSQELLELDSAFKSQNSEKIEKLLKDSIVIPLILGKIPRAFLVFSIANIRRLFSFVQKFIEKTDPNLTAKITSDNPLGAFDVIEETFISNDSSVIQRKFSGNGRIGSGANSKNGKAITTAPTIEAYYRLGLMIKRLPVSLVAFEKFLTEADGPLRNMKLDAPMSLAVEQQIVCQGYVSKNFLDAMKKLSEVFSKSVLSYSGTKISDLYFYDVSWLELDTLDEEEEQECEDSEDSEDSEEEVEVNNGDFDIEMKEKNEIKKEIKIKKEFDEISRNPIILDRTDMKKSKKIYRKLLKRNIRNGGIIDNLRKEWVSPEDIMKAVGENDGKNSSYTTTSVSKFPHTAITIDTTEDANKNKRPILRKCIRCGAISVIHDEVMFVPNSMAFVMNPVFQHYQRMCICGGSWANL